MDRQRSINNMVLGMVNGPEMALFFLHGFYDFHELRCPAGTSYCTRTCCML